MPVLDTKIISLIIQEEEDKKKIEKERKYRENARVHIDLPLYEEVPKYKDEDEEEPKRGVIVIDL